MARWPRDNQADLIRFYGDPGTGEVSGQLVPVIPPFRMYYDGRPIRNIMFHRKAAGALRAALDDIWAACGRDQAKLDRLGVSSYSGAYNPRYIRGSSTKWSNHAYGAAIDLDAEHNGFNTGHGRMPQFVIDAFKKQGARWGGDYKSRTDPMHFEFCDAGDSARPVTFVDPPATDGDSDQAIPSPPDVEPAPTPDRAPWYKRLWAKIAGGIGLGSGIGVGGMTLNAETIYALCALLIVASVLFLGWVYLVPPRGHIRKGHQ